VFNLSEALEICGSMSTLTPIPDIVNTYGILRPSENDDFGPLVDSIHHHLVVEEPLILTALVVVHTPPTK
jgi:hypothetical protein